MYFAPDPLPPPPPFHSRDLACASIAEEGKFSSLKSYLDKQLPTTTVT